MATTTETRGPLVGYDAARDSSARSVLLFPTNSRMELNTWTRRRLQEKNRALEGNFAFITRIKSKFGRCVAGKGIFPFPTTRDRKWNVIAKEFFERWASNPWLYSIDGSRDLWEDQRLSGEQLGAGDGEIFRLLARPDGMGPAIQALDPFEVGTPWGIGGNTAEDGVQTDAYLRPIGYEVCELTGPNDYALVNQVRTVAAQDMVHVFRRRRDKQLRGLPPLYSGLNDGNDVLDLLALEKAADKLHSLLAVAKTVKPENEGKGLSNQLQKILDADGNTIRLEEKMPRGAATVELGLGEDIKLLTSGRPGSPLLEGIQFYCRMIALGVDLPLSVVFSFAELGGTPTRAELEDAQNTFEMMQDLLVWRHSQRIYTWRLAVAQKYGDIPVCADPYWWSCDWHGPAKITVDYGRSAQANIDLMKAGMLSIPRYCEERGWDPRQEMRKQVDWFKEAQEYCAEQGVDFGRFMEATPGALPKGNPPPPASED